MNFTLPIFSEGAYVLTISLAILLTVYFVLNIFRKTLEELFPHRIYTLFTSEDEEDEAHALPKWLQDQDRLLFTYRWATYALAILVVLIVSEAQLPLDISYEAAIILKGGFLLFSLFIIGQIIPVQLVRFMDEAWLERTLTGVRFISAILSPFSSILYPLSHTNGESNGNGYTDDRNEPEDNVKAYLDASAEAGLIPEDENTMIQRVMELDETLVREVMTPRTELIAIDEDDSMEEIKESLMKHRKSRMPVYKDSIDHISGILYSKDLIRFWASGKQSFSITHLMRQPFFVPETKKISELLTEFQARKLHIAIVVDEYGGTSGLVTIEDLLEEIVGEIEDEYDLEVNTLITKQVGGSYLVNAKVPVDEISEILDIEIPHEDFDSVGGFVLHKFEKMPKQDESFVYKGFRFIVERADARRVIQVLIKPDETTSEKHEKPVPLPNDDSSPSIRV